MLTLNLCLWYYIENIQVIVVNKCVYRLICIFTAELSCSLSIQIIIDKCMYIFFFRAIFRETG